MLDKQQWRPEFDPQNLYENVRHGGAYCNPGTREADTDGAVGPCVVSLTCLVNSSSLSNHLKNK